MLQWWAISSGSSDTHDLAAASKKAAESSLKQATATIDLAAQAKRSADAAEGALAQVKANLVYTERPYVWVDPPVLLPGVEVGPGAKWNINYRNFGRSPALGITSDGRVFFGSNRMREIDDFFEHSHIITTSGAVVPPAGINWFNFFTLSAPPEVERVWQFKKPDETFWIAGRLRYSDRFGKQYHSDFCVLRLPPSGAWANCSSHNFVD